MKIIKAPIKIIDGTLIHGIWSIDPRFGFNEHAIRSGTYMELYELEEIAYDILVPGDVFTLIEDFKEEGLNSMNPQWYQIKMKQDSWLLTGDFHDPLEIDRNSYLTVYRLKEYQL